jgi:Baseplate J-like protein
MQPTPDDRLSTTYEQLQHQTPSTGPGANKARLETVLPTALFGPAQQGREPCPIILPHIAIGMSVAPNVPALPAARASGAALAAAYHPTLVLAPITNEEKGQETGAHEPHPEEEDAARVPAEPIAPPPPPTETGHTSGYPVITTPIPTPGDLSHTTPFPSALVQQQWSPRHQRLFLAGLGSGLLLYLLALVLVAVFVAPVATLTATVTLVPETKTLSTSLTVTALSTGTPEPARQKVAARLLEVGSPTQSQSGPTTGTGHAPARVGEGTVTFYNAAPYSQTVAAGTLLTGNDGVEIVTDAPAVIPAGNPPIEGEATVPAHATVIGPQGNIAPLDLNGLCCMAGISVKNTMAFHDGQDAYDFPMVTQADIDHAAGPLVATLTAATKVSLQGEVHQNERLAGPVQCQPAVTPDHPVGSDASQVTVSVQVACHAETYDYEAVIRLANGALIQEALMTLGSGYVLHGAISTTITPAGAPPHARPGTLTLLVSGQGVWVYQVNRAEQAHLSRLIAGLSRQQAIRVLQRQEHDHLAAIHIQVTGLWTDDSRLPADPARIQLTVVGR